MSSGLPPLKPGAIIGSYRVSRLIGGGGMGDVYEVVHCHIARRAALKVLTFGQKDLGIATRFVNEARAANVISHPGIVQIFEYGQLADGSPWLLMEYVEGETLFARLSELRQGKPHHGLDPISLLYQLAATLAAVHAKGIIHRDLKPGNIILTPDPSRPEGELAKLLDFGIAKLLHNSLHELPDGRPADQRTAVGMIMGTPNYMAPEQGRSSAGVDAKADVYSLGVIAYELLTGRVPIAGEALAVLAMKQIQDAQPLSVPGLPVELSTLVMSMLKRDPAERPEMAAVAEALGRMGGRGLSGAELRALRSGATAATAAPSRAERIVVLLGVLLVLVMGAAGFTMYALLARTRQSQPKFVPDLSSAGAPLDLASAPPDLMVLASPDMAVSPRTQPQRTKEPDKLTTAPPLPALAPPLTPSVEGLFAKDVKLSEEQRALVIKSALAKGLCLPGMELILIEKGRWLAPVLPLPDGLDEPRENAFRDHLQLQWIKRYPASHPLRVEIRCPAKR